MIRGSQLIKSIPIWHAIKQWSYLHIYSFKHFPFNQELINGIFNKRKNTFRKKCLYIKNLIFHIEKRYSRFKYFLKSCVNKCYHLYMNYSSLKDTLSLLHMPIDHVITLVDFYDVTLLFLRPIIQHNIHNRRQCMVYWSEHGLC